MAYINNRGEVVPTNDYERDLDAAFKSGKPICPWCGFLVSNHEGGDLSSCESAMDELLRSHE